VIQVVVWGDRSGEPDELALALGPDSASPAFRRPPTASDGTILQAEAAGEGACRPGSV